MAGATGAKPKAPAGPPPPHLLHTAGSHPVDDGENRDNLDVWRDNLWSGLGPVGHRSHPVDDDEDRDNLWSLVERGFDCASSGSDGSDDDDDLAADEYISELSRRASLPLNDSDAQDAERDEYISELSRRASLTISDSAAQDTEKARPTVSRRLPGPPLEYNDWTSPDSMLGGNDRAPQLECPGGSLPLHPERRDFAALQEELRRKQAEEIERAKAKKAETLQEELQRKRADEIERAKAKGTSYPKSKKMPKRMPKARSRPIEDCDSNTPHWKRQRCEEAKTGFAPPKRLHLPGWLAKAAAYVRPRAAASVRPARLQPQVVAPVRPVESEASRPVGVQAQPPPLRPVGWLEEGRLATSQPEAESTLGGHFDFIEVGTSDWGTISQYCAGLRASESGFGDMMRKSIEVKAPPGSIVGAHGRVFAPRGSIAESLTKPKEEEASSTADAVLDAMERVSAQNSSSALQRRKPRVTVKRPSNARGLAIEAVEEHLAALPSLPHVKKVLAAMDEHCGEGTLYCVSGENIARYMGRYYAMLPGSKRDKPVDVMWYAKSLSSLGSPQPELKEMLQQIGRLDFLEERRVHVLNWSELCRLYGVSSVDVVQIDCEGKDCAIIRGLLSHCDANRAAYPRLIMFEKNHLTKKQETSETIQALKQRGYRTLSRNRNNVVMQRTWIPGDGSAKEAGHSKAVSPPSVAAASATATEAGCSATASSSVSPPSASAASAVPAPSSEA